MKTKKQLRKPENWQDFESLCKKLWGEIWRCPEIKKNGRVGQSQFGVDVYGIPNGETSYYGIQCKGKDDYTAASLTESEIKSEIEKAKLFQPILKKYYIVTTANKDATIESIVREINIKHINDGLFEVHLFCWEDIVDLIEENPVTYNYYVNSQNFIVNHNISVMFQDESSLLTKKVKFTKKTTRYIDKTQNILIDLPILMRASFLSKPLAVNNLFYGDNRENLSTVYFRLKILNSGNVAIEDYNIVFSLNGKYQEFGRVSKYSPFLKTTPTYNVYRKLNDFEFIGNNNILVPQNFVVTDEMFILADNLSSQELVLKWQLLSRDYSTSGELNILTLLEIEEETITKFVEDGQAPRVETEILECFAEVEK